MCDQLLGVFICNEKRPLQMQWPSVKGVLLVDYYVVSKFVLNISNKKHREGTWTLINVSLQQSLQLRLEIRVWWSKLVTSL